MISFKLNTRKFTYMLIAIFSVLLLANLVVVILRYKIMPTSGFVGQLDRYLNFATEVNIPTFFNTILLFMAGQSFLLLGGNEDGKPHIKSYWFVLAAIFFFLSMDEYAMIHEWFSSGIPRKLGVGGSGIFKFAWIIPYGILVIGFGIYSLKVLFSLERSHLRSYIFSGGLYLAGVIVMEMLGGKFVEMNDNVETLEYYLFFTSIEESFEMLAIIWVLNINLKYLAVLNERKATL